MSHLTVHESDNFSLRHLRVKLFGDIIHWKTKKQSHVALSTTEAEYIHITSMVVREMSLNEMCKRLIKMQITPTFYEDNTSAAIKIDVR